jgi:hypothetical protein
MEQEDKLSSLATSPPKNTPRLADRTKPFTRIKIFSTNDFLGKLDWKVRVQKLKTGPSLKEKLIRNLDDFRSSLKALQPTLPPSKVLITPKARISKRYTLDSSWSNSQDAIWDEFA